jgi:DNA-binding FadR family transcriptional regulator
MPNTSATTWANAPTRVPPEGVEGRHQQHRAILDVLRDRDPDRAEQPVGEHLTWSSRLARDHFEDA